MILWRLNDATTANTYNYSGELSLQQNLATVATIIETDFRKIGYCANWNVMPDSGWIFLADSNKIKYLTDIDFDGNGTSHPNGVIDTIYYYIGPTSELTMTENPRDRVLYRIVNNEAPVKSNLGVTQFRLVYFNPLGDTIPFPVTEPNEIATMEINLTVENTSGYDNQYSTAFWRQIRLVARNLKNR
jgi:hypothetical protein